MMFNFRSAMLVGASALGMMAGGSLAYAADADAEVAGSSSGQLEEVIVTAQRRSENLQTVPIAVTAVTVASAEKQGVVNTKDLSTAIPGLQFSQQTNGAVPFLRGIGTTTGAVGNEPSIATYVDDVYVSSIVGSIFNFNNIESIAVLKGPQGTLFGRNATGGVIQVRTRDPSVAAATMDMSVGYANYNTWSGAFYGNIPIGDKLALNIAAYGDDQQDGWGKEIISGEDINTRRDYGVRAKLLFLPTPDTRILLSADYNDTKNQDGVNLRPIKGSTAIDGNSTYYGYYNARLTTPDFVNVKQGGASLKIEQDLHVARLVSISSYRNTRGFFKLDQDGTPLNIVTAPIHQQSQAATQEFQLLSEADSKLKWILGAFYFHDISEYDPLGLQGSVAGGLTELDIFGRQKTKSLSGFGQASYEVFADTHLTGGLRYTKDDRAVVGQTLGHLGAVTIPIASGSQSASFGEWTYRLSLDHQFTPDVLGYVSYNRGFKSGVYNLLSYNAAPVKPEILDAYEVGLKAEVFNRRLRINAAAFHYDYTNIQVQEIISGATFSLNAAKATIEGFDLDFTAVPTDHLTISGGLAVLKGHYDEFPNGPVNIPKPATCTPSPTELPGPRTGGNLACGADLAGFDTVRTPKFTGNLSADYVVPTQHGDLDFNVSYYYNDGFYWDPDNRIREPSYGLVNASIGWNAPNQNWGVRFWGRNLNGAEYCIFSTATTLIDSCSPGAPRTFGVTVSAHY